jgi:glycosyltransferase involved in cell wall biosynthesis
MAGAHVRIALVVPGGVDASGEYRVIPALLALIRSLTRRHEVDVFALAQEPVPGCWDLLGARIHNIGVRRTRMRALLAIRAEHRREPFDLVHAVFSGSSGLVAVASGRLLRIPAVVHLGGGELVALKSIGYGGELTWRGRVREAAVLRAAHAVTAASAPMLKRLRERGVAGRRVPLGVDLDAWPPQAPRRRNLSEPAKLIHTASLNPVKDQRTLLCALASLRERGVAFEMEIVGEDTLHGEMQRIARQLGLLSRVRFHGFLPQRALHPITRAAHLMVISSLHEAGPVAVLEAAAVGVPTVGSAVGHIAEWAPAAAVAVPPGDSGALAHATATVLEDEELRLRMARQAWFRALQEDAAYTASQFETLYRELIQPSRASRHARLPE